MEMTEPEDVASEVYHGPELECTVGNLLPGTVYRFRVRALNDGGVSTYHDKSMRSWHFHFHPPKIPHLYLSNDDSH